MVRTISPNPWEKKRECVYVCVCVCVRERERERERERGDKAGDINFSIIGGGASIISSIYLRGGATQYLTCEG